MIPLLILSIFFALAYGLVLTHRPHSLLRTIVKTSAVGALAVAAFIADAPPLLIAALAFGAMGDAFLAHKGERAFTAGLVAFLIGHLAYVPVLLGAGVGAYLLMGWRGFGVLILLCITTLILDILKPHLGALRWPVTIYACVILAMGAAAMTMPMTLPLGLALIGALMFIASDAILAFETFVFKDTQGRRRSATALWFLYWGGQMLIFVALV